jgi:hypothetical protein
MKMITLLSASLLTLLSCDNATKGSSTPAADTATVKETKETPMTNNNDAAPTELTWKELSSGRESSIEQPLTVVITSQQEMDALWSKAFKGDWKPEKRSVDFSKSSIVAIFLGTVSTGGHSVLINSLKGNAADGYKVEAEHRLPGKSCMSTTAVENPYYMAVTEPAISTKTEFIIKKKEVECE